MSAYNIAKDLSLSLVISVEADSEQEAFEIVQAEWMTNKDFVHNCLNEASVMDEDTYSIDFASHVVPIEELM